MAIVFKDANKVEVDGVNAGDIVSVIANYPARKNETLNAFRDFLKSEKEAFDKEKKEAIDAKQSELDAVKKELDDAVHKASAATQERDDLLALSDHPNIKQLKRQKAREQADRDLAEAIRRKAELDAEDLE